MVDVEKEMMKEIMADYHSGDPRKVASAKEQILNKAQRLITFMIKTINEQIQNIAQKKDTLCRRMYN